MSLVFAINPQLTFPPYHLSIRKHNKIACTVSPNQLCQISLQQALIPHNTQFHHSHFNSSILTEVGQIFSNTFSNVPKNHDPSPLQVQKSNEVKYDIHTKWVSYQLANISHQTDYDPKISLVSLVLTISPQLNFSSIPPVNLKTQ